MPEVVAEPIPESVVELAGEPVVAPTASVEEMDKSIDAMVKEA